MSDSPDMDLAEAIILAAYLDMLMRETGTPKEGARMPPPWLSEACETDHEEECDRDDCECWCHDD